MAAAAPSGAAPAAAGGAAAAAGAAAPFANGVVFGEGERLIAHPPWLPADWYPVERPRAMGDYCDRFYYSPDGSARLRSKPEVERFMAGKPTLDALAGKSGGGRSGAPRPPPPAPACPAAQVTARARELLAQSRALNTAAASSAAAPAAATLPAAAPAALPPSLGDAPIIGAVADAIAAQTGMPAAAVLSFASDLARGALVGPDAVSALQQQMAAQPAGAAAALQPAAAITAIAAAVAAAAAGNAPAPPSRAATSAATSSQPPIASVQLPPDWASLPPARKIKCKLEAELEALGRQVCARGALVSATRLRRDTHLPLLRLLPALPLPAPLADALGGWPCDAEAPEAAAAAAAAAAESDTSDD